MTSTQKIFEQRKRTMLELFSDPRYTPMKLKELAILLDIPREERDDLKAVLDSLLAEGKISLSIKKTQPKPERPQGPAREGGKGGFNRERRGEQGGDREPRGERKGGFNKDGGKPFGRKPRYDSKPYNPSNVTSY